MLGSDSENIASFHLNHAMHLNFRAKVKLASNPDFVLYHALKYNRNLKLAQIVMGKAADADGFYPVTIPVFISDKLATSLDKHFPETNRHPLRPFSESVAVPDDIFLAVSSIVGSLIAVPDWKIDLKSLNVKKIEITCGYSRSRSRTNFISLGDSAIHLAFYQSLNLGLKHAFELFLMLADCSEFPWKRMLPVHEKHQVLSLFEKQNPALNPIRVLETKLAHKFLIVTRAIHYGCYLFDAFSKTSIRLTSTAGIHSKEIPDYLQKINSSFSDWDGLLKKFEELRTANIRTEIRQSMRKKEYSEYLSYLIDLNSWSVIKISDQVSRMVTGFSLGSKEFHFICMVFQIMKAHFDSGSATSLSEVCTKMFERLPGLDTAQIQKVIQNPQFESRDFELKFVTRCIRLLRE